MKKWIAAAVAVVMLGAAPSEAAEQEYNIFAVPSDNINEYVAQFGAEMKETAGLETFHQKGYVPHATLYLTSFREEDLETVKAKVKALAGELSRFPLNIDGTHLTKGRWYFLDLVYTNELQRLSDFVVYEMSPMRNPAYEIPGWAKNIPSKAKTFARYGSPNVYAEFNPHLTQLAGEKSPKLDDFIASIKDRDIKVSGEVVGLGFAPVNPLGQVKKGDEVIFYFDK